MEFKEKTVKENYVFNGKILKLRNDEVLLPNGKTASREVVMHSGGSAVLCIKDGKVFLVKQYRYAFNEELWEIPAGKLNPGESPEETAIRELEEEGGIIAKRVVKLFDVYPTPAYDDEVIRIYQAFDFTESVAHLDEDEFLTSVWMDKGQLKSMLNNGEIKDAKTIIALQAVLDK